MRKVLVHHRARSDIRSFPKSVRREIGELLLKLQLGVLLSMPESRARPSLHSGAYELRIKDSVGVFRVFYYLKSEAGILDLSCFFEEDGEDASQGD